MKSKALAAFTVLLLRPAIGVTFAAPSYAGTIPPVQDKTATPPLLPQRARLSAIWGYMGTRGAGARTGATVCSG